MPLLYARAITFLGSWLGRAAVVGTLAASYFSWLYVHDLGVWRKAETATIEQGHAAGKALNEQGIKAKKNAVAHAGSDPAQRLRASGVCRDC